MVKGCQHRSSWTRDSSLLKGFRCASSGYVPDLWGGAQALVASKAEDQNCFLCTCSSCMTCGLVRL